MSWSVVVNSRDKQEIKDRVDAETYCPDYVKNAVADLVDGCPDDKEIAMSTYGHHNNGQLANARIDITVSG